MKTLWIGLAGFAGAVSRHAVDTWIGRPAHAFPWATFAVNVSGCFAAGLVTAIFTARMIDDGPLRAAITIGFLGAYTTFSTFALQTMRLGEDDAVATAWIYVVASVAGGIAAVIAGTWLGRALTR